MLLIHSGRSMAKWEGEVQNYRGFPDGGAGTALLDRGMDQAARFEVDIVEDEVQSVTTSGETFHIQARQGSYDAKPVLIATGLTHLSPDVPGVKECLGESLFFGKDCDAYRLQGQRAVIIGRNNEAVDYALGMRIAQAHGHGPPRCRKFHTESVSRLYQAAAA
jgi:thioredoxin reductase (NADPH)